MKHRGLSWVLAFLLTFFVTLTLLTAPLARALLDRGLWRQAASAALPAQQAAAERGIRETAAALPFRPETALAFYPPERLQALSLESADWLLALLAGREDAAMPDYAADGLAEAILEDPLYEAEGPAVQRRQIARDEGAYGVERAVTRAVMPLRISLLATALRRLPMARLHRLMRPGLLVLPGLAGLVFLLLLILRRRRWAGAALLAGALGALAFLLPLGLLDVQGKAAALSPVFGAQLQVFFGGLTVVFLGACGLALLAGLLLFLPWRRKGAQA